MTIPLVPINVELRLLTPTVYLPHKPEFLVWMHPAGPLPGDVKPGGALHFFSAGSTIPTPGPGGDPTVATVPPTSLGYYDLLQHGTEESSEHDIYAIDPLLHNLAPGTYHIFAAYSGDKYFTSSISNTVTVIILPARVEVAVGLSSSANPCFATETPLITATFTSLHRLEGGGLPSSEPAISGTVQLWKGNPLFHPRGNPPNYGATPPVLLGTSAIAGGVATFSVSLPASINELYAVYSGDARYTALTTDGFFQVVSLESASPTEVATPHTQFYFAWAGQDEFEFTDRHYRFDEQVIAIKVTHAEGDFPMCDIDIKNPKIGLLGPGRKVWAWLAYNDGTTVTPLFFGRLVGIPKNVHAEVCTISFLARPIDFDDQKEALADALKVLPYYDPLYTPYEQRKMPDHVLEGYSALWHCDRFSRTVSVSDIVTGEDGTLDVPVSRGFYDGLSVSYTHAPIRRVVVTSRVDWTQAGTGTLDITKTIIDAFANADTSSEYAIGSLGTPYAIKDLLGNQIITLPHNITYLMGAEGMVNAWPQTGHNLGGGWQVAASSLNYIGTAANGDLLVGPQGMETIPSYDASAIWYGGGVVVQVIPKPDNKLWQPGHVPYTLVWIPIYPIAPYLTLQWDASRSRTEVLTFNVDADVQNICVDKRLVDHRSSDSVVYLTLPSAHADEAKDPPYAALTEESLQNTMPIGDARRNSYFKTDRGQDSIRYMLLRARSMILARARAIDVKAEMPFTDGLHLSCRWNAAIHDSRLPGGVASGKVIHYELSFDGSTGVGVCSVTIGCTIGNDLPGAPLHIEVGFNTEDYADVITTNPSYVNSGYSSNYSAPLTGWETLSTGDIAFSYADILNTKLDDDGLNLFQVDVHNNLIRCYVTGGLDAQYTQLSQAAVGYVQNAWQDIQPDLLYNDLMAAAAVVNGVTTTLNLEMTGVLGGPFYTKLTMNLTMLNVLKTIDLGAHV